MIPRATVPMLPLLMLAAPLAAQAPAVPVAEAHRGAATITAEDFYSRIGVMAHDSMRGRNTPSPELDAVAVWIGEEFRRMGLTAAGDDGTYLQRYPILSLAVDMEASSLRASDGTDLAFGKDVLPVSLGELSDLRASGAVVVVSGSGGADGALDAGELGGAHVVVVPPAGAGANLYRERSLLGLVRAVAAAGAASILLSSDDEPSAWRTQAEQIRTRTSRSLREPGNGGVALLRVREGALAPLLASAGIELATLRSAADGPVRVRQVPGLTLDLDQRVEVVERASAPNVVAVLEGSDPDLKSEYVVFSGHMDHVGVGRPDETGDSIYNGADDDASGTVAVMEVAEAMASLSTAPRRSTMFVLVSGEEKGLWGSGHFVENAPVPTERMVANFNADMVGRNWPDTIVAIGREHSDLGETLARVNADHPEIGMTAIDDRWPDQNFYGRSDHFNFARKGVPILFFFNGTHDDYHRPSDELDAVDTEKAARIARLVYWLGLEVADAEERPRWNPESYRAIVAEPITDGENQK